MRQHQRAHAELKAHGGEHGEIRHAQHQLGDHHRQGGEGFDRAAEFQVRPRQPDCAQRTDAARQQAGDDSQNQRIFERVGHQGVGKQAAVPIGREALPASDGAPAVEGIDDNHQNRQIEDDQHQRQIDGGKDFALSAPLCLRHHITPRSSPPTLRYSR